VSELYSFSLLETDSVWKLEKNESKEKVNTEQSLNLRLAFFSARV